MTRASVTLGSAPFLLNHHLQRVERVFAGSVPIFPGNDALLQELSETFGAAFTVVPASSYGDDPWIQDELEFPTATAPGARRLDLVIDSVRDRGLDPFAERELAGPGVAVRTWGSPEAATTWDGLGNLETTPALSVAGRDFPFGRIYYGTGLAPELVQALQEQTLQLPFALDVSWLCVGHVDEVVSFVPDSSSPKGFKLLISHVPSAYALLDALPQSLLPRYYSNFGYWSLQTLLSDAVLRELNLALQQDEPT